MDATDFEAITWENLEADIYLGLHGIETSLYLERVITPALNSVDGRYAELTTSNDPGAVFQIGDIEQLRSSTIEAFALSIQSLWERQFRLFLKGCARELGRSDSYVSSLDTAPWHILVERFETLRGVPLRAFDSFPSLELLQLLGNACRHGDGASARKLYERRPDLWPNWPTSVPQGLPDPAVVSPPHPPFSAFRMPRTLLTDLAHAVTWFWEDHNYLYTNSIRTKHHSVADTLSGMRKKRSERVSVSRMAN